MHWTKKHKKFKSLKLAAYWESLPHKSIVHDMELPLTIELTRIGPRKLDSDNLLYAFKPIRDGIAEAFWPEVKEFHRDSDERIFWKYAQRVDRLKSIQICIHR